MYNPILDVFMMVVKKGSFSKAAQHLFLTHTAVIKQMNTLEEQLQTQLFYRSHQGISLTPAGQVLYDETKHIMSLSQQIILKVQEANLHLPVLIRVGVSTLYPCQPLMKIWEQISHHYPQFDIQMVPFTDDAHRLQLLGSQFDCLIGPYNALYKDAIYRFIPLGHYHFQIAINKRHPLAHNKIIHWQDLSHEKIMIMKTNYSPINDKIRQDLLTHCPHIEIMDIEPSYDTSTFNQCAKTQNLLLSLECWKKCSSITCSYSSQSRLSDSLWSYYKSINQSTTSKLFSNHSRFITIGFFHPGTMMTMRTFQIFSFASIMKT